MHALKPDASEAASKEKKGAALSSMLAAFGLTAAKLVVGLMTNSLGILSEAAHSGLDLVAAGVTYFAVRVSDKPPDLRHPYGHGKVENLSALIETLLLLATCAWIIHESVVRLFFRPEPVTVSVWSFAVVAASIVVDVSRSRMLLRVAKKHNSQALEADALHFSTDVWSSCVVLLGLIAVKIGDMLPQGAPAKAFLPRADAVAALAVSLIVLAVSIRLGRRAVDALLDASSSETAQAIGRAVESLPQVLRVARVRLRHSGPACFVDMTVEALEGLSLEAAHLVSEEAEKRVLAICPGADIMVHVEPGNPPAAVRQGRARGLVQGIVERTRILAGREGLTAHDIHVRLFQGAAEAELHVEAPGEWTLAGAHDKVSRFEEQLKAELPQVSNVVTHVEPLGQPVAGAASCAIEAAELSRLIRGLPERVPGVRDCHNISIHTEAGHVSASFHCRMAPETTVRAAHAATARMERMLLADLPELGRVVIHAEPE